VGLIPPRKMTLEQAIAYIQDDELVEVSPQSIRLRKRYLDPHERKKASRRIEGRGWSATTASSTYKWRRLALSSADVRYYRR